MLSQRSPQRGLAVPAEREVLARRTSLHAMYEGPVPPETTPC